MQDDGSLSAPLLGVDAHSTADMARGPVSPTKDELNNLNKYDDNHDARFLRQSHVPAACLSYGARFLRQRHVPAACLSRF